MAGYHKTGVIERQRKFGRKQEYRADKYVILGSSEISAGM